MTGTFLFRHSNMNVRPKAIEVNRPYLVEHARRPLAGSARSRTLHEVQV
jgi:hypothetical protein